MYGRRISSVFSISTTRRICKEESLEPKQANPNLKKEYSVRGLTGNEHGGEPPYPDKETSRHSRG